MLRRLVARLRSEKALRDARTVVDAGPVLERSHARRAGLGFLGKSANLLDETHGPWFFLAEAITDVEAEERARALLGSCGTCTRCIDACPTGAIVEPFVVDANRCISYLTIEHRGPIPPELRPLLGEWVFGCDVCSEVCPFGDGAPDGSARFGTHPALEFSLVDILSLDEAGFAKAFEGSAIRRARRGGLARNAAVVLGNRGDPQAAAALRRAAARDPDSVVREHARWALARLETPSTAGGGSG
jgi:epoxyqueuosine reductase